MTKRMLCFELSMIRTRKILWLLLVVPYLGSHPPTAIHAFSAPRPYPKQSSSSSSSSNNNNNIPQLTEVIGGSGRIGSQFVRLLTDAKCDCLALPRGVCPGSLSKPNTPIWVCTPCSAWQDIYDATLPHRKSDLVFCGNGLLPAEIECQQPDITVCVPHYAVLYVGAPAELDVTSPPSYIYGKHAETVETLLRSDGVSNTEIAETRHDIHIRAAQKLLWASTMWLLCHVEDPPLTVSEVYEEHCEILVGLVHELWPAFVERALLSQADLERMKNENRIPSGLPTLAETMQYIQTYTLSIPDAIPSLDLAISELHDRNGLLAARDQPLHQNLVSSVAGPSAAATIFDDDNNLSFFGYDNFDEIDENDDDGNRPTITVDLTATTGLVVRGTTHKKEEDVTTRKRNIVVVGSGVLGTATALHLAQQAASKNSDGSCQVTVVDALPSPKDCSATTQASWAWLNANQKRPANYQQLNSLGLHAWHCHPVLRDLVDWKGSLVRYPSPLDESFLTAGFYAQPVGPLVSAEWLELEPNARFSVDDARNEKIYDKRHGNPASVVYHFPNEGCVDPCVAVARLRQAAAKAGVQFVWNHNVTRILYSDDEDNSEVVGIECCETSQQSYYPPTVVNGSKTNNDGTSASTNTPTKILDADIVVVAAGIGSTELADLPMKHSPGAVVFARPVDGDSNGVATLDRIVVDTVANSHVLQRRDGSLVAGGGYLEFGGTDTVSIKAPNGASSTETILEGARSLLSPDFLCDRVVKDTATADRPVPSDGLPAVGYTRPGVYAVCSHSGMTLAPLLSTLAAAEITHDIDLDILAPYRLTRFVEPKPEKKNILQQLLNYGKWIDAR